MPDKKGKTVKEMVEELKYCIKYFNKEYHSKDNQDYKGHTELMERRITDLYVKLWEVF